MKEPRVICFIGCFFSVLANCDVYVKCVPQNRKVTGSVLRVTYTFISHDVSFVTIASITFTEAQRLPRMVSVWAFVGAKVGSWFESKPKHKKCRWPQMPQFTYLYIDTNDKSVPYY